MSRGLLIYKCRRCGQEDRTAHVPDLLGAILAIERDGRTPPEWGPPLRATDVHGCLDGALGVTDLQGAVADGAEVLLPENLLVASVLELLGIVEARHGSLYDAAQARAREALRKAGVSP